MSQKKTFKQFEEYWYYKERYNECIGRKKKVLNEINKNKRFNFANSYVLKDSGWLNNVIFADESEFNDFKSWQNHGAEKTESRIKYKKI